VRYLGTPFSLVLGARRLRVRIDLDDDEDESFERSPSRASGCEGSPRDFT
jgi:hypothetical protein